MTLKNVVAALNDNVSVRNVVKKKEKYPESLGEIPPKQLSNHKLGTCKRRTS